MYKHMIIPTDGSDAGTRAVVDGLKLARTIGAKVTILTVLQPMGMMSAATHAGVDGFFGPVTHSAANGTNPHQQENDAHQRIDELLEQRIRASGVDCTHIHAEHQHLSMAVRLAAEAEECDLVVMPAHERYGLLGRSIDSETAKLLSQTRLPVLVLH